MLRYLFLTALFLAVQSSLWAREIHGLVKSGNQILPGIIVTDGTNFTQTGSDGTFQLNAADAADFIYIFTPSGYSAPFASGTPLFYQNLKAEATDFTFELEKLPFDDDKYALLATADPQTQTLEQFERFERESVTDLKASVGAYEAKKTNTIGIALGDIAWDELDLFSNYKQAMAGLGIPFYPVIGNHDHDLNFSDDYASAEIYRQQFGPTYYGFNLGLQHYIVLDDIIYKGDKKYDEALTTDQLDWVRNYLQFIPKGSELVFAMHAPFRNVQNGHVISNGQQLLDICKDYRVSFISGHTHLNSNMEVAPGIIEHNIGAICGTWWTAETCRDGTPNGYQVFEGTPEKLSWYYKSVGHDRDYQLVVFDKGVVANQANAVVAKVWNWDQEWKIEWFEDGKAMGAMKQVSNYDPQYLHYLAEQVKDGEKRVPGYKQSQKSFFYFAATPSLSAKKINVVATDRFGQQYEKDIELNSTDVEAHRGGAGLMPENTIQSMLNGVKLGANTLELDLHITKDGKVIVVHDAYLNPDHTTKPDGSELTEKEAQNFSFYQLTYEEIKKYDTGSKPYKKFPEQEKVATYIPLVSALIDSVEQFTSQNNFSPIHYNIEIKSDEDLEKKGLIPDYKDFTDKAMAVLLSKKLADRLLVQSFDTRTLNYLHDKYPETRLAFLVANVLGFNANMKKLNFTPEVYSPYYPLVNRSLMENCREAGVKVIPWTVDDEENIKKILGMQVDGIISNYPDRVLRVTRGY